MTVQILKVTWQMVVALAVMDLMIVMATMLQIGAGVETQHIPFWDAQIKFIINLI